MRVHDSRPRSAMSGGVQYRGGTHGGPLEGVEPTGKAVRVDGQLMSRIVDGKFVEEWVHWDTLGLLRQIGAVPPPSA